MERNQATNNHVVQKKRKPSFKRKIHRFMRAVKNNRLYQIALCIILILAIFFSGRLVQRINDKATYEALMEAQKEGISTAYEKQISELNESHKVEIQNLRDEYENLTPEEQMQQEAEYIAKVLYGTAKNNSDRDKRTVVWCILNRVDHANYPNSVKGVCEQEAQWMGYSNTNPILNDLYELALTEVKVWHSNYRPVMPDYIYMSWSSKEIILRDTYGKTNSTRYWQAG